MLFAVPSITSKTAPLPHLLGRKGSHFFLRLERKQAKHVAEQAQGEHSAVSVNIGLPGQGEEREDLRPLPAEAGTALAKAPRPAGCSLPNSPLPTCWGPSQTPWRREREDQMVTKELLLLPLTEAVSPK